MDILYNIITLFAGLGIFLVSVSLICKSMQTLIGDKLRNKLENLSDKKIAGITLGTVGTVFLQSSTAIQVLLISFVGAGIISFAQSVIVILGVNIGGSLILSSLIFGSFKISIILGGLTGVGAIMLTLCRKERTKLIGKAFLGFGMLFLSINIMSQSMEFFRTLPAFNELMSSATSPLLLIVIGAVFTMLIQSSFATNAILVTLCGTIAMPGSLLLQSALWVSLGAKIGTTFTGYIASIGMKPSAKRVAITHTLFNVITAILMGILFYTGWTYLLESWFIDPAIIIVIYNIIASILTVLIWLPFNSLITNGIEKIYKSKDHEDDIFEMDNRLLELPALAMSQFNLQLETLLDVYTKNIKNIFDYAFSKTKYDYNRLYDDNIHFNLLCENVGNYLLRCSSKVRGGEREKLGYYQNIISRYQSLAHRAEKILLSMKDATSEKYFTMIQINEARVLFGKIMEVSMLTKQIFHNFNNNKPIEEELITDVVLIDTEISKMKLKIKKSILTRYKTTKTKVENIDRYARLINELEQIGEHYTSVGLGLV